MKPVESCSPNCISCSEVENVLAIAEDNGVLLCLRPSEKLNTELYWEFPSGTISAEAIDTIRFVQRQFQDSRDFRRCLFKNRFAMSAILLCPGDELYWPDPDEMVTATEAFRRELLADDCGIAPPKESRE
jgi:hypothetical protein